MKLEVIVTTIADAIIADHYGADRVELVTALLEGGLTPSYALIEGVVQSVTIPVHVMVRPHSRSFRYSMDNLRIMQRDVELIRELGAAGIVIGALNEHGKVDEYVLQALLEKAGHMNVTFHRAIDQLDNQEEALECLLKYPQINRVLTSGGKPDVTLAVDRIEALVAMTRGTGLTIVAGSGLKIDSLPAFLEQSGVSEIHFGTGARINSEALQELDPNAIGRIKKILVQITERRKKRTP